MKNNYSNNYSKPRKPRRRKRRSYIRYYVLIALIFIVTVGAAITTAADSTKISDTEYYTVSSGDTLWNIALCRNTHSKDIRNVMDDIMRLNDMKTMHIQPGQSILVPVYQ